MRAMSLSPSPWTRREVNRGGASQSSQHPRRRLLHFTLENAEILRRWYPKSRPSTFQQHCVPTTHLDSCPHSPSMSNQPQRITTFPPTVIHHHLTKSLTASEAEPLLSNYLSASLDSPHLHPDAWLYLEGVKFGPKSGPNGGWGIHHLRRIEAGLRGETLEAESKEDLIAKFGEDTVGDATGPTSGAVKESDDARLDELIESRQATTMNDSNDAILDEMIESRQPGDEKKRKKQEKKDRVEKEKAAKRRRLEDASSGGNTPYQDSMVGYGDQWQRKEEYELEQTVLDGEVGSRDPAGSAVKQQNATPPAVVKHDANGEVVVPKKARTEEEKAARKAAKKARRSGEHRKAG